MFLCLQKEEITAPHVFFTYIYIMHDMKARSNNCARIKTDGDNSKSIIAHCPILPSSSVLFLLRKEREDTKMHNIRMNFRIARSQIPREQESAKQTRRFSRSPSILILVANKTGFRGTFSQRRAISPHKRREETSLSLCR